MKATLVRIPLNFAPQQLLCCPIAGIVLGTG